MNRALVTILAGLIAVSPLAAPPLAHAEPQPDCSFWYRDFGAKPAASNPTAKTPKITFTPPPSMALGRDYLFQFGTSPADADGHLKVFFWGQTGPNTWRQTAESMHATVVDGKVVDANGRRVDAPSLFVHPTLVSADWPYPLYLVASFRDLATGKYICKKVRPTFTF